VLSVLLANVFEYRVAYFFNTAIASAVYNTVSVRTRLCISQIEWITAECTGWLADSANIDSMPIYCVWSLAAVSAAPLSQCLLISQRSRWINDASSMISAWMKTS